MCVILSYSLFIWKQDENIIGGFREMGKEKPATKVCKHCKTEIPYDAKVCPQCRKKQGGALKWVIIGVVAVCIIGAVSGGSDDDKPKEAGAVNEDAVTQSMRDGQGESEKYESQKDTSVKEIDLEQPSTEIFISDLLNTWSDYIGKKVTVSYRCNRCDDDKESIQSDYDEDAKLYLRSYVDNYRQFQDSDYITITGIVDKKSSSYIEIKSAHIDDFGSESQLAYESAKGIYDEKKRIEAEAYEAEFRENAESPTYDDLMRYPDTYKEKQIKITVKIVRVEPDGIIFDGDIEATMSGESIALYDGREKKEPKLREGDSVTIYGYGKGTTTVKVQDVSGLIPKTVDKYDIPAIDIRYIDF